LLLHFGMQKRPGNNCEMGVNMLALYFQIG